MSLPDSFQPLFKKYVKVLFGVPLTLLSFGFLVLFIFRSWNDVNDMFSSVNMLALCAGVCFLSLFFLVKAYAWKRLLHALGFSTSRSQSFFLLSLSEIKRYIPGNILGFVARVFEFSEASVPKKIVVQAILIESLFLVVTSIVVGYFGRSYVFDYLSQLGVLEMVQSYSLLLWICAGLVFSAVCAFVFKFRKRFLSIGHLTLSDLSALFELFVVYVLGWVFFGAGSFLVSTAFFDLSSVVFLQLVSFFVLSWLVGYLSFVAPMGLGVREVVLALGLSTFMPLSTASSLVILLRLFLVISEVLFFSVTYVFFKFSHTKLVRVMSSLTWHAWTVFGMSVLYFFYMTYVSFERHVHLFTGRFDLGNMDQTVWNTSRGVFFSLTNPDGVSILSRLAVHADFILIVFAPFYYVWQDARVLLFFQSLVLACGGVFVYLLALHFSKKHTLSLAFSISYFLNFWVQRQNLFDFHAVSLATTFIIASFYFLVKKRYVWFLVFLMCAFFTKENVYLVGLFFGTYLFLQDKKFYGVMLSFVSICAFFAFVYFFIPFFRGGEEHFALSFFGELGESPIEFVQTLFYDPAKVFSVIFSYDRLLYYFRTFLPLGFLSLFSPYVLFALPEIAIYSLSENENLRQIYYHYGAVVTAVSYITSIFVVVKLISKKYLFFGAKFFVYYVITFSVISTWFYGVLPGSNRPYIATFEDGNAEEKREILTVLRSVSPELKVSATNNLAAHLSYRDYIYVFPHGVEDADAVLLYGASYAPGDSIDEELALKLDLLYKEYVVLYSKNDFEYYIRKAQHTSLPGQQ